MTTILNETPSLSRSLWTATAPPVAPFPPVDGSVRAEVCVVGAGITGLSAALHLAERGQGVVVLDAEQPGWGASGRNGGQVIPGIKADRAMLERMAGSEGAKRVAVAADGSAETTFALIGRHDIECNARRGGWIRAAATLPRLAEIEHACAAAAERGIVLEMLDVAAFEARTGLTAYVGGSYDARAGVVHPQRYCDGLASAIVRAGGAVHGGARVTKLSGGEGAFTISTAAGRVKAERVVVALNGYADGLIPALRRSVVPVTSIQVATEPLPPGLLEPMVASGVAVSDIRRLTSYFRTDAEGRFLLGGRGSYREDGNRRMLAALRRQALTICPGLAGRVTWSYHWGGNVAMTPDHVPRLVEPQPGVVSGFGYSGRGVAMATLMGRVIADRTCGMRAADLDFPLTQMRTVPLHALHRLGVTATVAWYRLRDGLDAGRSRGG